MVDALIITFIESTQHAILGRLNGQGLAKINEDFYEATLKSEQNAKSQDHGKIIVAPPLAAGSTDAALFASKAIKKYSPRHILVVGACSSLKNKAKFGDIVIASEVIDYDNRNITNNKLDTRLQSIATSSRLLSQARSMQFTDWRKFILLERPDNNLPELIFGPIISTKDIILSRESLNILSNNINDIVATEIKSFGIIKAIKNNDKSEFIVINVVYDEFDKSKSSTDWLEYASDVAATFSIQFIKHIIVDSYKENSKSEKETQNLNKKIKAEKYIYAGNKHFHFYNESNLQQKCLGIRDYAKAIAHVLDHATEEVCISIMGHWGRGKTFLMKTAEEELTSSDLEHKYRTIWFSAWKYRTVPEVWVHLYQTFAEASAFDGILRRLPRTVRSNMHRVGTWPIYMALFSIIILLFPLISKIRISFGVFSYLLSLLGIIGLAKVAVVSPGVIRTARKLSKKYLRPTSYEEKLGLQASVGQDLKYLINGWLGRVNLTYWHYLGYGALVLAIAFTAYCALSGEQVFINVNVPLMPNDTTLFVIILLWIIAAIIAPIWTLYVGNKKNRILLIVDDLDRCPSNQILDIIESIKLLLEDKTISEHVQVVMLIEFEMLKQAILCKYKIDNQEYTPERIIEDNMQKLFLSSLTLPPLTDEEVDEIASTCILSSNKIFEHDNNYELVPINNFKFYKNTINDSNEKSVYTNNDDIANHNENIQSNNRLSPSTNLDSIEQKALLKAINDKESWSNGRSVTPRAIQSILMRYQFARYLLMLQKVPFDPFSLAMLIIKGNCQPNNNTTMPTTDEVISSIVRRVPESVTALAGFPF